MNDPKSARDLLLTRHASAERRLDALRHEAIAGRDSPVAGRISLPALLHALFHPHRHVWGSLAMIWVGLLAFHLTFGRPHPNPTVTPSAEATADWLAQQQSYDLIAQISR